MLKLHDSLNVYKLWLGNEPNFFEMTPKLTNLTELLHALLPCCSRYYKQSQRRLLSDINSLISKNKITAKGLSLWGDDLNKLL